MDSAPDVQVPVVLPVLPGLAMAGQYALTEDEPTNRGDTLDAFVLPERRVALLVADVVGHGLAAALAATQVRAILWSSLADGASLSTAVGRIDRHAARNPALGATALGVVVLDLEDGSMEYTAAGLLPPLVLAPHESPRLLGVARTPPLGTAGTLPVQRAVLRPEDMVVLCTNGLVDSPQAGLRKATDALMSRAACALDESADRGSTPPRRADDVGHGLLSGQVSGQLVHDDIALLVAQRMPDPQKLSVSMQVDTFDVSELRGAVSGWLEGVGASLVDHISLGHALVELATNVVKHAYANQATGSRPIDIAVELEASGDVVATVSDRGRWRTPDDRRSRGLTMAGGLMDRIDVRRSDHGTEVEVRSRLGRPVQLWRAEEEPSARPVPVFDDELSAVAVAGSLTASGPVDEASADIFHAALLEATRAGTTAATVDLSDVTHLASPGVQSLFEFLERSGRSGVEMRMVAPRGSPAREVLDLVGLPAGP